MSRRQPPRDLKILWGLAAARCSCPTCRVECVAEASQGDPAAVLGEVAHIVAYSNDGPRANPSVPLEDRECYDNWVLLCAFHHAQVDHQPNTYTVDVLRQWKTEHELWVRESLSTAIPNITFAELNVVCAAFANSESSPPTDDLRVTTPREKMVRNGLTDRIVYFLQMGLAAANQVEDFITHISLFDSEFPERLRNGFVTEYNSLVSQGLAGDDLFFGLLSFCDTTARNFRERGASLAVLAYLFQVCEVFHR